MFFTDKFVFIRATIENSFACGEHTIIFALKPNFYTF